MCLFVHMRTSSQQRTKIQFKRCSSADSMECRDYLAMASSFGAVCFQCGIVSKSLRVGLFCFNDRYACVTWESITYLFIENFVFSLFHIIVIVDSIFTIRLAGTIVIWSQVTCFENIFSNHIHSIIESIFTIEMRREKKTIRCWILVSCIVCSCPWIPFHQPRNHNPRKPIPNDLKLFL